MCNFCFLPFFLLFIIFLAKFCLLVNSNGWMVAIFSPLLHCKYFNCSSLLLCYCRCRRRRETFFFHVSIFNFFFSSLRSFHPRLLELHVCYLLLLFFFIYLFFSLDVVVSCQKELFNFFSHFAGSLNAFSLSLSLMLAYHYFSLLLISLAF